MEDNQDSVGSGLVHPQGRGTLRTLAFQSALQAPERTLSLISFAIIYYIIKISICTFFLLKSPTSEGHLKNFVITSIGVDFGTAFCLIRKIQNPEQYELLVMDQILKLIYLSNHIYGNFYYYTCDICEDTCPILNTLVYVLLVMGYCQILMPCIVICCVFMCLNVLIIILSRTTPSHQNPATEEIINNLPCVEYKPGVSESVQECSICSDNFKEGEKVSILPCGSQHIFHETCIKTWIRINSVCPMCRTPIQ